MLNNFGMHIKTGFKKKPSKYVRTNVITNTLSTINNN